VVRYDLDRPVYRCILGQMRTLSHESVLAAGANLVSDVGWPGLSLRAVAARLAVTPMALYRHVPNSDALCLGVIATITEAFVEVRISGDALADLEWWARRAHTALTPYPGAASYLLSSWFNVAPVIRSIEKLLELVYAGGWRDFEAVAAVNAVFMYVLMRSEAEQTIRGAAAAERSLNITAVQEDLPRLFELSEHYTTARFDLHFDYGLRVLLDGIGLRHDGVRRQGALL
jgi:AcrR family transcriptional regulator